MVKTVFTNPQLKVFVEEMRAEYAKMGFELADYRDKLNFIDVKAKEATVDYDFYIYDDYDKN